MHLLPNSLTRLPLLPSHPYARAITATLTHPQVRGRHPRDDLHTDGHPVIACADWMGERHPSEMVRPLHGRPDQAQLVQGPAVLLHRQVADQELAAKVLGVRGQVESGWAGSRAIANQPDAGTGGMAGVVCRVE